MISILESRFGHVVDRLVPSWGKPTVFHDLFDNLLFDGRSNRTGWPGDAWEELQFLNKLHSFAYEAIEDVKQPVDDGQMWV